MRRHLAAHLRSNVIGYLALFVALSTGTAWALSNNSVGSKHIINSDVRSKDIEDGNIRSQDINDDSLTGDDIAGLTGDDVTDDSLTDADIDESTLPQAPDAHATIIAGTTNVSSGSNKNISSAQVTKREIGGVPQPGQFCIETDVPDIKTAMVSAEHDVSDGDVIASVEAPIPGSTFGCPVGAVAHVITHDTGSSANVDRNFTIWLSD